MIGFEAVKCCVNNRYGDQEHGDGDGDGEFNHEQDDGDATVHDCCAALCRPLGQRCR